MSLSNEQIALLQDAAKMADIPSLRFDEATQTWRHGRFVEWCPHLDRGDLYDLMAAGRVEFDWLYNIVTIFLDGYLDFVSARIIDPKDFTSQAWAVITVCAMAQRRKEK